MGTDAGAGPHLFFRSFLLSSALQPTLLVDCIDADGAIDINVVVGALTDIVLGWTASFALLTVAATDRLAARAAAATAAFTDTAVGVTVVEVLGTPGTVGC
jgi:hypothetical protein